MGGLHSPVVTALGWGLVHFLWQGTLLGAVAALLLRLSRRASTRHAVASVSLLVCLALPVLGTCRNLDSPRPWLPPEPTPRAGAAAPGASASAQVPQATWSDRVRLGLNPLLPHLVLVWSGGSLVMMTRVAGGWMVLRRLRRRGQAASRALQEQAAGLARKLGLGRAVTLAVVDRGSTPVTYGLWKPVVLLPVACLTGLSPQYLEALLAHELAHAARWDYAIQLLQTLAEVLLFFHPVVWWLSRRIRTEREQLCDDLAAEALGDPRRLALALDALDDLQPSLDPNCSTALAAGGGNVFHRIERLIRPDTESANPGRPWLLPALLVLGVLVPLAAGGDLPPVIPMPADMVRQIDGLARQEGIDPHLLRAVAFAESRFNPGAKSSAGALGLLQVMPETARKYGATDLKDRDQVAAAGARYLRHLLDRYAGDWTKAVAAYNGGEEAVDAGRLSEETRRYAPEVLRLAQARAIAPEEPLTPDAAEGRLERWRDGQCTLYLRYFPTAQSRVELISTEGGKLVGELQIGSRGDATLPEDRQPSRPVIRFMPVGGSPLKIRISEPGRGTLGEAVLPLDQDIQVFRIPLGAPR